MTKYKERPELVKSIDIGLSVWGLAILDRELLVASLKRMELFVYDPVTLTRLRIIHLAGLSWTQRHCCLPAEEMSLFSREFVVSLH